MMGAGSIPPMPSHAAPQFRPTAGVLLAREGKVLLVRRGGEPARGKWDVPGGFLEPGEQPEDAARREIREELGIELGPLRLLLADLNPLADGTTVLDLIFEAASFTGTPRPADDVTEVAWFDVTAPPEDLAFDTTRRILERARAIGSKRGHRLLDGTVIAPAQLRPAASFSAPLERLPAGWTIEGGEWSIHDGLLCGRIEGDRPAALWLDRAIDGDHAILVEAETVPPHDNDINAYWEGSGTIASGDPDGWCTIGGVAGWWDGLTGIERHPRGVPRATGRILPLRPGQRIELLAGRRGATDFLFVDGVLVMQLDDPDAPRRPESRVAIATWNSHVHVVRAAAYSLR
jgi:ADP-ribose pyrophosphatase YjhB (NUDIX family)